MTTQTIEQAVEEIVNKIAKGTDSDRTWGTGETLKPLSKKIITQALQTQRDAGAREERERVEAVLKEWIPTDPMGYGVNFASKGMHLDDHKRNFAKSILKALTPPTK